MTYTSFRAALLLGTILLSGCQTLDLKTTAPGRSAAAQGEAGTGLPTQQNAIRELVAHSNAALEQGELDEASRLINLALKLDITNPDLQILNGLVYHMMGLAGDTSKYALAEQGYRQALRFDPGNLAAHQQLGLLYMDQRRYGLAQGHFAAVALHEKQDPSVLYNLATASYYARDPQMAAASLKQLMEVSPDAASDPAVLKGRTLALAAMDDRQGSDHFLSLYRYAETDPNAIRNVENRVGSWRAFYDTDARYLLAQYDGGSSYSDPYGGSYGSSYGGSSGSDPYGSGYSDPYGTSSSPYGSSDPYDTSSPYGSSDPYGTGTNPYGTSAQGEFGAQTGVDPYGPGQDGFYESDMVVVDVILIGTQEDIRESRGINLLSGLQLQFGNPLTGMPAIGYESSQTQNWTDHEQDEALETITSAISIPAVTYSLNIANSLDANSEILAKPSLVAQSGETSEFFSGTEILAAAVSGGSGDSVSVQKEVGVKLAVTPEVLPDDMIRLHVVAERTFLTDPSNSVVFEFRLDTTKTNVNSTVTMRFGETLILGGLTERETSKSADGVPILMDIPIVNLMFSQRVEREFERSILILMTPRRPQYTRQADEDRRRTRDDLSDLERDIERLAQRHRDWFTPQPTFVQIRDKLRGREFFEEFRTGDMEVQSWQDAEAPHVHIEMVRNRVLEAP